MKPSSLLTLLSSASLFFPVVADALEMPSEKLGLWEIRMQNSSDGGPLTAPVTMQYCVNAALLESAKKSALEKSKNCSKNEVRNEGSKWTQNSVCKVGSSTATGQMTREFDGDSATTRTSARSITHLWCCLWAAAHAVVWSGMPNGWGRANEDGAGSFSAGARQCRHEMSKIV